MSSSLLRYPPFVNDKIEVTIVGTNKMVDRHGVEPILTNTIGITRQRYMCRVRLVDPITVR